MNNRVSRKILSLAIAVLLALGGTIGALPMTVQAANDGSISANPAASNRLLDVSAATALAENSKQDGVPYIRINSSEYDGIQADAAKAFSGIRLEYDSMSGQKVQMRMYIANPGLLTTDVVMSNESFAKESKRVQQRFERFFSNKLQATYLPQAEWNQPIRVAIRADFKTIDSLYAYTYDSAKNTYQKITKPDFRMDSSGKYVFFTTQHGGAVVVSEGALNKRTVPLSSTSPAKTPTSSIKSSSSSSSNGSSSGGGYVPSTVLVTGVTVSPNTVSLSLGTSRQLTATVAPSNASNQSVSWSSSDSSIADVDSSGLLTAVSSGTATITATTADGGYSAGCIVTVNAPPSTIIPVTGVTVSPNSATLTVGDTQQLTATITPSNADNQAVTWSSDDSGVASVDSSGLVTAVSSGTATITATTADGGYSAGCIVTVNAPPPTIIPVTGVAVSPNSATLTVGDTQQLTATITPSNADNQAVTWSSDDSSIADVDSSGLVTAVSSGTATITVTTADGGYTDAFTVNVTALVNAEMPAISGQPTDASVFENDPATLTVSASVTDGGTLSYQWYSNTTNSNSSGTVIPSATANSFTPPTTSHGTTYYYCEITNTNTGVTGANTATVASDAVKAYVKSKKITSFFGKSGMQWFDDGSSMSSPMIAYVTGVYEPNVPIGSTFVAPEDSSAILSIVPKVYAMSIDAYDFTLTYEDGSVVYYKIYLAPTIPTISFSGTDANQIQQTADDFCYSLDNGATWTNMSVTGNSHQLTMAEIDTIAGTSPPYGPGIKVKLCQDIADVQVIDLVIGRWTSSQNNFTFVYWGTIGGYYIDPHQVSLTLDQIEYRTMQSGVYSGWTVCTPAEFTYNGTHDIYVVNTSVLSGRLEVRIKGAGNKAPGWIKGINL